jgi:hypothetical protein
MWALVALNRMKCLLTWHNVVPEDSDIFITVSTALLMPKATSMHQLMFNNALVQAPWSQ